jgi:hypothetical protein
MHFGRRSRLCSAGVSPAFSSGGETPPRQPPGRRRYEGEKAISHTNRNFVLAYVFLVALPVLGLVGILKRGRSLSAPFSVDGVWKIESGNLPASPCGNFLSSVSSAPLSISQSGKSLVVTLSGGTKTASGTLEGKTIKAQFTGASGTSECSTGAGALTLTATLDPMAEPRTLSGTLSVEGCASSSCAPMEFRAVRQPRSPGGTR